MSQLKHPRINNCVISSRLTHDPELKYTPSGTANMSIPVAFDRSYKKGEEWVQETSYLYVVVWAKLAEYCAKNLTKGSSIVSEGYIQMREYTNRDGQKVRVYELVANKIHCLEKAEVVDNSGYTQPTEDSEPF